MSVILCGMRIKSIHTAAVASVVMSSSVAAESGDWHEKPVATVITAADKGDKKAQLELGKRYESGLGVEADTMRAIRLYGAAARSTPKQSFFTLPLLGLMARGGSYLSKIHVAIPDFLRRRSAFSRFNRKQPD